MGYAVAITYNNLVEQHPRIVILHLVLELDHTKDELGGEWAHLFESGGIAADRDAEVAILRGFNTSTHITIVKTKITLRDLAAKQHD